MRAVALYGALGSLVLTALAAAPAGSADPLTAEARGVAVAAGRAAADPIVFGRCPQAEMLPVTVQCGTVKVPLDYAQPTGRQIALTVSRSRARAKARQGALVYNPGGPGASSTYFPMAAGLPEWKRIAGAYDLVGYAPRGVARSAPLSCQDPRDFTKAPTESPTDPSQSYKQERIAQAQAYAEGCARNAGDALRYYTSINNARDLDVLRAALGEKKLTFMGASYGTYFGAVYATLFPTHVRRMVFDSAVDPDPRADLVPQQPRPVTGLRGPLGGLPHLGRQARRRLPPGRNGRRGPGELREGAGQADPGAGRRQGGARRSCRPRSSRPGTTTTTGRAGRPRCRST